MKKKRETDQEREERLRAEAKQIANESGQVAFVIGNKANTMTGAVPSNAKLGPNQRIFLAVWPDGWKYGESVPLKATATIMATMYLPGEDTILRENAIYPEYFFPAFEDCTEPLVINPETGAPLEWGIVEPMVKLELVSASKPLEAVEYRLFWSGILDQDYNRERLGTYVLNRLYNHPEKKRIWTGATNWTTQGDKLASFESVGV